MNAVEIEQAISALAEQAFDASEFPFRFLQAFGFKDVSIKRLRSGASNKSDIGGILHANNIHLLIPAAGTVAAALTDLKASAATTRHKARFILATDGITLEAEDLTTGDTIACDYDDFSDKFGFFLPLAGITTVKQVRESSFDIRATSRLNRLYVELLKDNPEWGEADKRPAMNHFMARLIFCFFAEDTDIFRGSGTFTSTIERMSDRDASNTHTVIGELFRAMSLKDAARAAAGIPRWAIDFPYVNGGLFSGSSEVPRFSRIARSYLLHIGHLDWRLINPDIFGSMIQAVADDEERGALGMHYTSVPNILKVLNPLFLDDLRAKLAEAGDNARTLLNLRRRMAHIRVFDPACGSGNFLVIAYKQMREIEAEINRRRREPHRRTEIPLTNFRGIELRDFPAEIARLALIIAEYQCDVTHRGQKEALAEFLPLEAENWITCGNALRLDWLKVCPPAGPTGKQSADDLFETPLEQSQIDFENVGGETYICGNPPYKGGTEQDQSQKNDMMYVFGDEFDTWRSLDYILAFFYKAKLYINNSNTSVAFVSTNSVCQGEQVFRFWPSIIKDGVAIEFAVTSFLWTNLASNKAAVSVCIVGLSKNATSRRLYEGREDTFRIVENINSYLIAYKDIYIRNEMKPKNGMPAVVNGNKPADGGGLIFDGVVASAIKAEVPSDMDIVRPFFGAHDGTHGVGRYCLWLEKTTYEKVKNIDIIADRFDVVERMRLKSDKPLTRADARTPYKFQQVRQSGDEKVFQVPRHSSEDRSYYPIILLPEGAIVGDGAFAFYDPPLWAVAIFASRLNIVWTAAVCGKIKNDYRFSNTLGWNTIKIPTLTEFNKSELTRCAENILLAREIHFPDTIAELYDADEMPVDLREAHDRNDEVLERIYIGRRFRNDTERLEKLFDLYTKMTAADGAGKGPALARTKKAKPKKNELGLA